MDSSSDLSNIDINLTPDCVKEEAKAVVDSLLPESSKERYLKAYEQFMNWRSAKKVKSLSENVFLAYFNEISKTLCASTLWSNYSMLKSTINNKHKVDMKKFTNLTAFLKRKSENFRSKKSKIFTSQEVEKFLNDAPDDIYLATKVVLIFGICGACRSIEFSKISVSDVEKHDQIILVKLLNTKTKIDRQFVVRQEFTNLVEKYEALRPNNLNTDRYFVNYQRGKCLRQVIGKNKFANMPRQIAAFLNLPNPESYTGHCFRRTSATLLADSGASISTLKRHGGWKSTTVAEGYVEDSVQNKTKIASKISECINMKNQYLSSPQPGTSRDPDPVLHFTRQNSQVDEKNEHSASTPSHNIQDTQVSQRISNINMPGKTVNLSFSNCTNFTVNFN